MGWELIFSTPYLKNCVEKMALNAKVTSSSLGDKMLAVSAGMFYLHFHSLLACARLSVSVDEQKKRASSEIANE